MVYKNRFFFGISNQLRKFYLNSKIYDKKISQELIGKQDPYCKFTLGKAKEKTKTVKKGGTNPYFNEEECVFWIGKESWPNPLVFSCFDEDIGSDDLIGGRRFSLLPLF